MHSWLAYFILHTDILMSIIVKQHQCMYGMNYINYKLHQLDYTRI